MNVLDLVERELDRIARESRVDLAALDARERRRHDRSVARRIATYLHAETRVLGPALAAVARARRPELAAYRERLVRRADDALSRLRAGDAQAPAAAARLRLEMTRYGGCLQRDVLPLLDATLGERDLHRLGGEMLLVLASRREGEGLAPVAAPRRARPSRASGFALDKDGIPVLGDALAATAAGRRLPASRGLEAGVRLLGSMVLMPLLGLVACAGPARPPAIPLPPAAPPVAVAPPPAAVPQGSPWTPEMAAIERELQQAALADGRVAVVRGEDNQLAIQVDATVAMTTRGDGLRTGFGRFMAAMAETLSAHPSVQVRVIGHGDAVKGASAKSRAPWAVVAMRFLVDHGVAMERLTARTNKDAAPLPVNVDAKGGAVRSLEFQLSAESA
jgi:flagellar motor protein MotB